MVKAWRKFIPSFLKPFLRFIWYKQERAKVFREPILKRIQDEKIKSFNPESKKLVLFLIEGADYDTGEGRISGGIISIVSLCEESRRLKSIHGAEVLLCTLPGQHLIQRHKQFKNEIDIFRFDQLSQYFKDAAYIMIHLPEYLCVQFNRLLSTTKMDWLLEAENLHINVLNQNIKLMPPLREIEVLKSSSNRVTITTAHDQYCTTAFRDFYQVALHKFSVWISPEKYHFKKYESKRNLIVVSPDEHPEKIEVLRRLSKINGLQIKVIQNLTYEEYKEIVSDAKWTLTFGEGLDAYLIEPIFSGAVGFAVYNNDFFTNDFKELPLLYDSIDQLSDRIVSDITKNDNEISFNLVQKRQFELCAKYYSREKYIQNIEAYYRENYTYG